MFSSKNNVKKEAQNTQEIPETQSRKQTEANGSYFAYN
jgi:hypothetical protein